MKCTTQFYDLANQTELNIEEEKKIGGVSSFIIRNVFFPSQAYPVSMKKFCAALASDEEKAD